MAQFRLSVVDIRARAEAAFSTKVLNSFKFRPLQVAVTDFEGNATVRCDSDAAFGQRVYFGDAIDEGARTCSARAARTETGAKTSRRKEERLRYVQHLTAFERAKVSVFEEAERRL